MIVDKFPPRPLRGRHTTHNKAHNNKQNIQELLGQQQTKNNKHIH